MRAPTASPAAADSHRKLDLASGRVSQRAVWSLAVVSTALLLGAGALLAARRYFDAMISDLPRIQLATTALFLSALVAGTRIVWRRTFPAPESRTAWAWDQLVGWGGSAALVLTAVGCCYPGVRNSDWLIWLPLIVADQFWRQTYFDNGRPGRSLNEAIGVAAVTDDAVDLQQFTSSAGPQTVRAAANEGGGEQSLVHQRATPQRTRLAGERLVQQLFRVRLDNGDEAIYGALRADFQANQRHATLHVGFCPPLRRRPEIEVDACSNRDAKIKVVQALAHGVRLDVRLPVPTTSPRAVQIDMAAIPCGAVDDDLDRADDEVEAA